MAELPEVETAARDLRAAIIDRTIEAANVLRPEVVRFTTPDAFSREITDARVTGIDRRGKWILVRLSGQRTLAIHFMLFGRLRLEPRGAPHETNLMLALRLDDDSELRLTDRLGYARVALLPDAELNTRLGLDELGPEILDESFMPETLFQRLAKKRVPVKPALLDQHVVAGLGNRDADESLWRAQIDPRRLAKDLSHEEAARLTRAMQSVLQDGIARRGTMPDLWGRLGTQMSHRAIFERAGQPCPRCGAPIERIEQNGRQTFFCPVCQQ